MCELLPLQKHPISHVHKKSLFRICFSTTLRNHLLGQELCWSLEVQRFCSPRNATWQAGQETHTSVEPPPRHQRADRIVQCSHWHSSPLNKCVEIKSTHRITHTFKVQYVWGYMFTRHAASAAFILRTFHHPHRRHAATRSRLPFPSTFLGHPRSSVLP